MTRPVCPWENGPFYCLSLRWRTRWQPSPPGRPRRNSWAPFLTGLTGVSIAVGFVLYHAIPVHSWFTNAYWGRADVLDWAMVAGIGRSR